MILELKGKFARAVQVLTIWAKLGSAMKIIARHSKAHPAMHVRWVIGPLKLSIVVAAIPNANRWIVNLEVARTMQVMLQIRRRAA